MALHNFFGLTETISMTHVLRNEDIETRPDSIGRLLLFAREEVIPGYYQQPERLAEALTKIDGRQCFRTGDLALVDEEGSCVISSKIHAR